MTGPGDSSQGALLIEIATHVNQLTRPIRHKAPYDIYNRRTHRTEQRHHHTTQPSLLDQLRQGLRPARHPGVGSIGGSYESRPPLNPDALHCMMQLEVRSARWASERLGLALRPTVEGNLGSLVGAAGGLEHDQLDDLAADVRGWRTWARTVTSWDPPAWRPYAACPDCGQRTGLRVRLDERTAVCVACTAYWTPATIGDLADHIKALGEDVDRDAAEDPRVAG